VKKITRKALLTAKLYRPGKGDGGGAGKEKKLIHQEVGLSIYKQYGDTYIAEMNGQKVGEMNLSSRAPYASSVEIHPNFRRQGIASKLYDIAEKDIGRKMMPSPLGLSEAATAMWKNRLSSYDDPKQKADLIREAVGVGRGAGIGKSAEKRMMPFGFNPDDDTVNGYDAGGRTGYRAGGYAYKADGGEIDDWHSVHEREAQHFADGGVAGAPQKTVKAYKLFKTKKSAPGKLFPLFVDANTPVPVGQWVDAKAGEPGKTPGKVKSKLGDLAFRPGWHAGDLPIATHIGGRSSDEQGAPPDYRPADQVWAEVEMPDDVDWQSVANSRGQRTKAGTIDPKTAHITDQVPVGGHYRYKTNSNMTGNWMIGGSMRVNRILSDDEVKSINDAAGTADLPRHPDYPKMATGGRTGYADGGSTGKLHARFVNSKNFYSRGAEAARQLSQNKGSPQQMRAMLEKAGVKPEEFAQSGFDEAFSGKPSVTSEEIFQHFHHKKPDVRATQLLSREHDDYDPDATYETQFDEFTLHGLQNYREHLLKLPEGNNNFEESRHWPGQKNVVAHIRMGDRRTPADLAASRDAIEKMRADPNLTRSIGEEPANWGSGAADLAVSRGTITKEEAQNLSRIKRWRNAVMEGYKPERVLHVEEIQSDWGQAGRKHGFQDQSADGPPDPNKPPQGPFVNSTPGWTNLALKHVLTEAVKGGYNKLVISPGQANADMYGLDEGRENGMKSFYDQIVPTQLNKLAKGLDPDHPGVQMFSHTLPPAWGGDEEGYKGHALEITDGMRDAVKKGLPMYKRGGMAPISNPMVGKAMALARNLTRR
jgi:hypothetical protein